VDGRELQVTEFAYEYGTPEGPRQTRGNQFVHEGWRLFFGGLETVTLPTERRSRPITARWNSQNRVNRVS
jgi:hypothetical protein